MRGVALLAEGVDRNSYEVDTKTGPLVALLAEGVDRNLSVSGITPHDYGVALLAEGVDRNMAASTHSFRAPVALLAEGVDRNVPSLRSTMAASSRPPRGGRG